MLRDRLERGDAADYLSHRRQDADQFPDPPPERPDISLSARLCSGQLGLQCPNRFDGVIMVVYRDRRIMIRLEREANSRQLVPQSRKPRRLI
jgi:hypothetical protein